jgi:hypothetical protein
VRTSGDGLADRLLVAVGEGGAGEGTGGVFALDPGNGGDNASAAKSVTGGSTTCSGGGAGTLLGPGAAGSGVGCNSSQPGARGRAYGGWKHEPRTPGCGRRRLLRRRRRCKCDWHRFGRGGGSDYPDPVGPPTGVSNVTITDGAQTPDANGNGQIIVTYANPSAVTFASASASRTATGVLVRWHTGTETELLGFHVYRARGHSGQRVTRSLVAAKGSVSGASYRYTDRRARRGIAYRYRMKAVRSDGTATWFGPVRVI